MGNFGGYKEFRLGLDGLSVAESLLYCFTLGFCRFASGSGFGCTFCPKPLPQILNLKPLHALDVTTPSCLFLASTGRRARRRHESQGTSGFNWPPRQVDPNIGPKIMITKEPFQGSPSFWRALIFLPDRRAWLRQVTDRNLSWNTSLVMLGFILVLWKWYVILR